MSFAVFAPPPSPIGATVPAMTPHAVSVSLPTWQDNVDYEEGAERVKEAMKSGYPRFYIHHLIQRLAAITTSRFGQPGETCLLVPTAKTAASCQSFLLSLSPSIPSRVVPFPISSPKRSLTVYACFVREADFGGAKQFWQHTGDGISSRFAERCLILLGEIDAEACEAADSASFTARVPASGGRYSAKGRRFAPAESVAKLLPGVTPKGRYATTKRPETTASSTSTSEESDELASSIEDLKDEDVLTRYVEERYGRNLDLSLAPLAKLAMRRRIAGVLRESPGQAVPVEQVNQVGKEVSDRGVIGLTEDDVYLYPTGMSAIFHAHQLAMGARQLEGGQVGKSVCFGFPYTDTLKILEKWGPGCHFFGHGRTSDLPSLRDAAEAASPPLLAVFCEFPSNPLLRSPPLQELRKLADEFGFMIVVDETIAGFVNVEVLPLADIVVSSLTKVFSGDCNVMGGSLVVNPKSTHYAALKKFQDADYEDHYFDEDAIYMERNSRDFQQRVAAMNFNTEIVCDLLRARRVAGPVPDGMIPAPTPSSSFSIVKEVYYPKYMTPEHYIASLRPPNPAIPHSSGFGSLFSVTFTSLTASRAFFDALNCYKGPSLGTNFTIACPYTILAHYMEREWAQSWGVEDGLVRISIGLEGTEMLKEWIEKSLIAAEKAVQAAQS